MSIYPPNNIAPKKGLSYVWNYLGSSLKTLASALQPYMGGDTGVKKYVAILMQNGIDPPVATVLENTYNGVPVWTRDSPGNYILILPGQFVKSKTVCFVTIDENGSCNTGLMYPDTDNEIYLETRDNAGVPQDPNTIYSHMSVMIMTYP